jgi:hypothetical protein
MRINYSCCCIRLVFLVIVMTEFVLAVKCLRILKEAPLSYVSHFKGHSTECG